MLKTISETTAGPVPITSYFYDGSILLAEKVGNQIQKIYINDGQGIVGMVRPIYGGSTLTHYQRLYYLYDSLGSVNTITGEHGLPLQNYTYSPYGTCLNVIGDPINNLQFVGRYGGYLDNDTGLTYFWHRWYNSKDGRWISRDPIGIKGGIYLFRYVGNNPVYWTDSYGLFSFGSLVGTYGNYGGPGWTGGERIGDRLGPPNFNVPPKDLADSCYRSHDMCYMHCECNCGKIRCHSGCDAELLGCLGAVGGGGIYGRGASAYFFLLNYILFFSPY